uniref:Uncharacterized protein n=1 Tax=Oryza sativa subsp. japonica TaxID=39947 RepID=Q6K7P4_ORYSJ|nr:hypothetical protein [Oryza sativa Japonica Group]
MVVRLVGLAAAFGLYTMEMQMPPRRSVVACVPRQPLPLPDELTNSSCGLHTSQRTKSKTDS